MEDFEKLRNIGAREISKHTHIALNKIQYILDRNYKELKDNATTHGLLQILEREYHISLKQWEDEYKEFWKSYDSEDEEIGPLVNFKVTHEVIKPNSKTGMILSVFLVVFLSVGFFTYRNFTMVEDSEEVAESQKTESQVQEEKLKDSENETLNEDDLSNLGKENNATNVTAVLETTNSLDASASTPINVLPKDSNEETLNVEVKKVSIVPLSNVWVGIVYLDSRKRASFMTENAFDVDLGRPQTIVTGHGMLEVDVSGEKSAFNSANKMFFVVDKEGNFTQVTQGQYDVATRGLGW
ncbi:hypothetical protein LS70_003470 [Helicobacter sp. MIT 11-5569]|uniref:hypothetical protein n=1 Tax=Helicobacter sp. MIT 11-5569 TaxID=1548151 RepID=UPI00051FCE96|nr:hypothetical protein [Helicobacter sp. MIT 11-5569]TLD83880.1 hypothetical protein LS70_003470 [Helicobacter sp. MIT 11-5569]